MKRRDFVKVIGAGIGTAMIGSQAEATPRKAPNLLYIFPDQFRREALGFWATEPYQGALRTRPDPVITPTLDKLAEQSLVFTQAVSTCPVCSPHRAMLMSGMYPWANGVVNNCHETRTDGLRHDIPCFTDVLAQSGYETGYIGKTHWERNEPVFDAQGNYVGTTTNPGGQPMNAYDTYIPPGPGRHGNSYWFQCVKDAHWDPRVYSSDPSRIGGRSDGQQYRPREYSPRLEADVLIDYLKNTHEVRDPSRPFCVFWSPNPPHAPYDSEKDCDDIAWREHYRDRSPAELLVRENVIDGSRPLAEKRAPFYFANVTGVDTQIGRVLQALEASGEADHTIVVFTSDHGEMMGSQGKFGKLVIYEEAFCVPYLIRFPRRLRHRLEDLMISTVDIMPTILGLMGLSGRIPSTAAGRDFSRELISGDWSDHPKPKSALFLGFGNRFKGVRTDRYSLQINEDGEPLVWDNTMDPYQVHPIPLAGIPEPEGEFLRGELGRWLKESNDPWFRERRFASLIKYPA
jgi:arylsulfatase A-like enzyme